MSIFIDKEKCKKCGKCEKLCPQSIKIRSAKIRMEPHACATRKTAGAVLRASRNASSGRSPYTLAQTLAAWEVR